MTVVCAWCQRQGRMTVLREKEPFDHPVISHGICEEHARAFMAELRARPAVVRGLAIPPRSDAPMDDKAREVLFGKTQYERR